MSVSDLLWIIPGDKTNENNLVDGQLITKTKQVEIKQHIDIIEKFQKEYHLPIPSQFSIVGYAKTFCELGMVTLINMGKIDGKYGAYLFLPEQLTPSQIETLEALRKTFEQEFYSVVNLFKSSVYSSTPNSAYKLKEQCFRDLYIESILDGKENKNGIELFYQEIEKQKTNTRKIK
jgi:hypothetical protein